MFFFFFNPCMMHHTNILQIIKIIAVLYVLTQCNNDILRLADSMATCCSSFVPLLTRAIMTPKKVVAYFVFVAGRGRILALVNIKVSKTISILTQQQITQNKKRFFFMQQMGNILFTKTPKMLANTFATMNEVWVSFKT